jgi:hypothetical protein
MHFWSCHYLYYIILTVGNSWPRRFCCILYIPAFFSVIVHATTYMQQTTKKESATNFALKISDKLGCLLESRPCLLWTLIKFPFFRTDENLIVYVNKVTLRGCVRANLPSDRQRDGKRYFLHVTNVLPSAF